MFKRSARAIRHSTLLVMSLMLAVPAMAQTTIVDEDAAATALGLDGSGRFLVGDITKACPFIEPILRDADPADRILILSDSDVEILRHGSCGGACGMLAINNVMVECQQETGSICAPIAGIHDGKLYDLSVDLTGSTLEDCGF